MATEILHISDTHLGYRQYRSDTRKKDYMQAFKEAIDIAVERDVDAVVHGGDLFDNPNPSVATVNECLDALSNLDEAGIPFLGIVGNHERKREDQWIDLIDRFGVVERLEQTPRYVGDETKVAVYGIDAVRKPSWNTKDMSLEEPDMENGFSVLCMHELLNPPVPGHMADYPTEEVLERIKLDIDALALGDYHEHEETEVKGTKVWYPGSTERTSKAESEARHVVLAKFDNKMSTSMIELQSPRQFVEGTIQFSNTDAIGHAEERIEEILSNTESPVAIVTLEGESTGVTPKKVRKIILEKGAAVARVVDNRGLPDIDSDEIEGTESEDIEELIDERVSNLDTMSTSDKLESIIRDLDVKKSNIREKTRDILEDSFEGDEL